MARPRKDSGEIDARERLTIAFWELLEEHELRDLSVSMIVDRARCNRGTFYYHFDGIDELMHCAIAQDVLARHSIADAMFGIASNNDEWIDHADLERLLSHLCLVMEKGGMKVVNENIKAVAVNLWRAILCPDGSQLAPEAEIAIHFHTSGVLGALSYLSAHDDRIDVKKLYTAPYFVSLANLLLSQLSEAQGIPVEEISARIAAAAKISRM